MFARLIFISSIGLAPTASLAAAADLTFNKDIAPLLWTHCGGCHRPDASAPFGLIEFKEVVPRARQIVAATKNRMMPPWLPEQGFGEFANERRLTQQEIDLIERWVKEGAREGSASDLSPRPQWTEGWQLGAPDLVVSLPAPYDVRPGPTDVFRAFVIPIPLASARYVRGVEVRPGNRLVHHASIAIDRTRESRRLDEADPEPGFSGGMISQGARSPESRAIGWTPGITPALEPEGMAWRLEKGTDLVIQLHMLPSRSGQTESVQPSVGFYFTDVPPARMPLDYKLGSKTINIPAGEADYAIEDALVLPVDVEVLSVSPHAHYLATEMKASAALPDGSVKPLIWIKNWDFHWQDEYRFATPVFLPKGTRVTMKYSYDNSSANQQDRTRPPSRAMFGPRSADEMGDLWLRLLPATQADAAVLARLYKQNELTKDIAAAEGLSAEQPRDAKRHNALALSYMQAGRVPDAIARLETALRLDPDYAEAHNNMGHVLQLQGRHAEAIPHFREAVRLIPTSDLVHLNLANALQETGDVNEAISQFRVAIELNPGVAGAHNNLGVALGSAGLLEEAERHFRQALEIQPDYADAQENLAMVLELRKSAPR